MQVLVIIFGKVPLRLAQGDTWKIITTKKKKPASPFLSLYQECKFAKTALRQHMLDSLASVFRKVFSTSYVSFWLVFSMRVFIIYFALSAFRNTQAGNRKYIMPNKIIFPRVITPNPKGVLGMHS